MWHDYYLTEKEKPIEKSPGRRTKAMRNGGKNTMTNDDPIDKASQQRKNAFQML